MAFLQKNIVPQLQVVLTISSDNHHFRCCVLNVSWPVPGCAEVPGHWKGIKSMAWFAWLTVSMIKNASPVDSARGQDILTCIFSNLGAAKFEALQPELAATRISVAWNFSLISWKKSAASPRSENLTSALPHFCSWEISIFRMYWKQWTRGWYFQIGFIV